MLMVVFFLGEPGDGRRGAQEAREAFDRKMQRSVMSAAELQSAATYDP
jgi:hypothetical protein